MDVKNRLRNKIVKLLQRLSTDKLTEISNLLSKIEWQLQSKEKTLKLAGSWKDIDEDLFVELTEKLHERRGFDRLIDET